MIILFELISRYPDQSSSINPQHAFRLMAYARRRIQPPQPATLHEMGRIIMGPSFPRLKNIEGSDELFFQGNLEHIAEVGGDTVFDGLVFANRQFVQSNAAFFREVKVLGIDGTFQVVPRHPTDMAQLVTVHIILDNVVSDVPIHYCT